MVPALLTGTVFVAHLWLRILGKINRADAQRPVFCQFGQLNDTQETLNTKMILLRWKLLVGLRALLSNSSSGNVSQNCPWFYVSRPVMQVFDAYSHEILQNLFLGINDIMKPQTLMWPCLHKLNLNVDDIATVTINIVTTWILEYL